MILARPSQCAHVLGGALEFIFGAYHDPFLIYMNISESDYTSNEACACDAAPSDSDGFETRREAHCADADERERDPKLIARRMARAGRSKREPGCDVDAEPGSDAGGAR